MHYVPPGTGEIFYMRTLLNYVCGPKCYEDMLKVGTKTHLTFKAACSAMGLLDDDKEYVDAIKEASHWGSAHYLRRLFVILLVASQMTKLEFVFKETCKLLGDDILYCQRCLLSALGKFVSNYFVFK